MKNKKTNDRDESSFKAPGRRSVRVERNSIHSSGLFMPLGWGKETPSLRVCLQLEGISCVSHRGTQYSIWVLALLKYTSLFLTAKETTFFHSVIYLFLSKQWHNFVIMNTIYITESHAIMSDCSTVCRSTRLIHLNILL